MGALDMVILAAASVLVLIGSALMWRANDQTHLFDGNEQGRSFAQYQTMVFVFAALAAWLHHFSAEKDAHGRVIWRYLFYGFLYFAAVFSWHSWENMDYNRHFYDTKPGRYLSKADNQRAFGGEVLAYAGILLFLWNIHGTFKVRGALPLVLFGVAIALNVIGSVILWKLKGTEVAVQSPIRDIVFQVAVSQWITLLILGGSVLHEHLDGAHSAVLGVGIFGMWYLANGFQLKAFNKPYQDDQVDKAWAGSLFCWFSAWVTLLTARFAAATFNFQTLA